MTMHLEDAWTASLTHYRVRYGLRVTVQVRAINTYTYVEDFVIDGAYRQWKIRRKTIRSHGRGERVEAKARAERLWKTLNEGGQIL